MAFTPLRPAPTSAVPPTPACLSGRYLLTAELGRGGFSRVYTASAYREGNRLVAVKRISLRGLEPAQRAYALHGFQRELAMLSALGGHPNLPRLHEYAVEGDDLYLVMDYIAGETLDAYRRRCGGHLPLAAVLAIGLALCLIIHDLHSCQPPVIFRDLKPENVVRAPDGKLYLIDFGIARWFRPGQEQDTMTLGTPGFAPPEQCGGATTQRSDIYALGALLHFLLTGDRRDERPFFFAPLGWQWDPLFGRFEWFLLRMVALDEGQRPASAVEVWRELGCLAAGVRARALGQHASLGYAMPYAPTQAYYLPQGASRVAGQHAATGAAGRREAGGGGWVAASLARLAAGVGLARVALFGFALPAALAGAVLLSLLGGR